MVQRRELVSRCRMEVTLCLCISVPAESLLICVMHYAAGGWLTALSTCHLAQLTPSGPVAITQVLQRPATQSRVRRFICKRTAWTPSHCLGRKTSWSPSVRSACAAVGVHVTHRHLWGKTSKDTMTNAHHGTATTVGDTSIEVDHEELTPLTPSTKRCHMHWVHVHTHCAPTGP